MIDGVKAGDNLADTSIFWPDSDAYKSYGGVDDLCGLVNPQTSDINGTGFGLSVCVKNYGEQGRTAAIDHVRITVYYSETSSEESNLFFCNG